MRRRHFLLVALALAAGLAVAALDRLLGRSRRAAQPAPPAAPAAGPFPAALAPVVLAVADVVVPREGGAPAASEIELLPLLERRLRVSKRAGALWSRFGGRFGRAVRAGAGRPDGSLDPERLERLCRAWYREVRTRERPAPEAAVFEELRRDVLRAYYASPAGWAALGYQGPPRRSRAEIERAGPQAT